MNLWNIVDGSKKPPPSNVDSKVLNEYQRHVKKVMSIIGPDLANNQLAHINSCKGSTEVWNILCSIHETKSLSNIFFIRYNFFTCKMQEDDDLLDHVRKVKALADQLVCLEVPVKDEDIIMTLFESLSASYEFLDVSLILIQHFHGNTRNNQSLHYLCRKRSTRLLAIVLRKQFGLDNFWRMWDMCKKDRYPSCVTINDA